MICRFLLFSNPGKLWPLLLEQILTIPLVTSFFTVYRAAISDELDGPNYAKTQVLRSLAFLCVRARLAPLSDEGLGCVETLQLCEFRMLMVQNSNPAKYTRAQFAGEAGGGGGPWGNLRPSDVHGDHAKGYSGPLLPGVVCAVGVVTDAPTPDVPGDTAEGAPQAVAQSERSAAAVLLAAAQRLAHAKEDDDGDWTTGE